MVANTVQESLYSYKITADFLKKHLREGLHANKDSSINRHTLTADLLNTSIADTTNNTNTTGVSPNNFTNGQS